MKNNEFSLLNHKPALFVLFFTEMWERFSYYGMRAIFVLFLTSSYADGGWEWSNERALTLLGWYTGMVYLTPVIGGWLADRYLGYQKAVAIGAFLMTLGHGAMALETVSTLYLGVTLLVLGNGLFKPNVTSIVSGLYDKFPDRKDGAYTLFYMGVNSGSFLGVLLCGFLGENLSWSWGFGLAGIFMFLGMLQFWFGRAIFEGIGAEPQKAALIEKQNLKVSHVPEKVQRDRYIVVSILAFFTVFFWASFEQASGSLTIFANKYTQRVLDGSASTTFKIVDTLLTIVPLLIITWVLIKLFIQTFKKISLSNIVLGFSFAGIWGIVIWKLNFILKLDNTEVPASWFGILNSLFIITFAPIFSKIWESKFNPSAGVKFGLGMIFLGVGFGGLAFGASGIPQGAETASVTMLWLVFAYLFSTWGELCLSPVGLSYVSKLVPSEKIGIMFGLWYLAIAIGNKLAGSIGGKIDYIVNNYSVSTFFLIFTIIPLIVGVILVILSPWMKKMMHGVK